MKQRQHAIITKTAEEPEAERGESLLEAILSHHSRLADEVFALKRISENWRSAMGIVKHPCPLCGYHDCPLTYEATVPIYSSTGRRIL